ncbi:unnamed protein product [Sphagnum jensenii]|uniref:Uncharacterized protein n=1 Tax=Sphagnum jensenii TaxID=128206 RepID=A0ABP1ABF5_9BRYO
MDRGIGAIGADCLDNSIRVTSREIVSETLDCGAEFLSYNGTHGDEINGESSHVGFSGACCDGHKSSYMTSTRSWSPVAP